MDNQESGTMTLLAMVFSNAIKGIKNGKVRIITKCPEFKRSVKGRGVGIPPFLTPKP
jgi:hypothetical protein